jgi:hypothetical protein
MNRSATTLTAALAIVLSATALAGCASGSSKAGGSSPAAPKQTGYAVHDVWLAGSAEQKLDGVSCKSQFGPWHIVMSADLAAQNLTKLNTFYDITLDQSTKKGTLTGEEHSATAGGDTFDGTAKGTTEIAPDGQNYLIKIELDYEVTWHRANGTSKDPSGNEHMKGHRTRELHVTPATAKDCP